MTTAEAADRLKIKPRSVVQLIRRGLLAATWNTYARRFEIEDAEVERYAVERRAQHRPKKG
jgi:excisionase family DNA binding protein